MYRNIAIVYGGQQRKQDFEPLPQAPRRRAMVDASSADVLGEGSAAGSAKLEESKRVGKETSRKRQTPRSNADAEARGPGDQREKEEKRGRKTTEREKSEKSGRSRSRRSSSSAASADETKKRTDEPSALPSSPSTARSTAVKSEEEHGQKKKKERRRRSGESRSSASSRTPTARKSSKDGSNRRQRPPQSPSSDLTLVEAKAQEVTAAPATRAPSSASGSKRRKRSSSSKMVLVEDDIDNDNVNGREEPPRAQQTTTVPPGVADAERVAIPPSPGTGNKDSRSNAVAAPCYDVPTAAVEAKSNRECLLLDNQPVTHTADPEAEYNDLPTDGSTSVSQSKNGVHTTEPSCSDAEAEGSAPEGGARMGRQESSAGRRGGEAARENLHVVGGKPAGADDAPSRRHRRSTTEERPRRPRGATGPPPSTALGVKVIDEGDTKHFVLIAGEATAGEGKSGSGSDRSRGGNTSSRNRDRGGSRSDPVQHVDAHSQRQERSNFREKFATTVPARGGDVMNPTTQRSESLHDAFEQAVVRDDVTGRVASQHASPAERSEVEEKQRSWPTNDHHPQHPLMFSRKVQAPACTAPSCPASPSNSSSGMAPSFSITTNASTSNHARDCGTPAPCSKRPSLHHGTPLPDTRIPGNNPRGAQPSPTSSTSSSSSPLRGRPVSDRTAKYVAHQASFHADISDDYVDLNSPLGTVRGEKSPGGEESEMGKATSSPPAEESTHHDNAPVVSSSRPPPDTAWETSSRGNHQKASCGAVTGSTEEKAENLLASSVTPSAAVPVGSLAGEDGNALFGSNQPGFAGPDDARQPPSEERLAGGSVEDDDGTAGDLLHFRTDAPRHLVCGGRPELFFLRPNESLAVTRIEGSGRLLVTVREEAGAAAVVVVDRAIVHDSAAHFGHAAAQVG